MLGRIIHKMRFFVRKDKEPYLLFYKILGFYPYTLKYYEQALLHKSLSRRIANGSRLNNERLEFLGDAVLESVITDILFHHFENESEGFMTNARSRIVKRETLNQIGRELGLHKLVKNEIHVDNRNSYLCGNAFEALIGAIYLDQGYKRCRWFMEQRILKLYLDLEEIARREENHKSRLLEWTQRHQVSISFDLLEQTRDKHNNQIFLSLVTLQGMACTQGRGYTKKESHQEAARRALKKIEKEELYRRAILEKVKTDATLKDSANLTEIASPAYAEEHVAEV